MADTGQENSEWGQNTICIASQAASRYTQMPLRPSRLRIKYSIKERIWSSMDDCTLRRFKETRSDGSGGSPSILTGKETLQCLLFETELVE